MERRGTIGWGARLVPPRSGGRTVVAGHSLEATGPARSDGSESVPLELSYRISAEGEAVVSLGGDLDIVSADVAIGYVTNVIGKCDVPLAVDLASLDYCDASGLRALERMADYAEQVGCPFRLSSPSESLVKIMRITGLDRRFLADHVPAQAIRQ